MPDCSALVNHECIDVNGFRKPCCRFDKPDKAFHVTNCTIDQYKRSEFYTQIVDAMKSNWHPGCKKCKQEEDRGDISLRNLYDQDHTFSDNIESIELSLSNKCNLMCRMCGPAFSSSWQTLVDDNDNVNKYFNKQKTAFSINDIFYEGRDLSKLRMVKYLGGEPFITPEILQFFRILDNSTSINNITFLCTTNGTLFPKKYMSYLQKFKKVVLHVSLDGVNFVNDYIRVGKTWELVDSVIDQWIHFAENNSNIEVSLFSTIQAYNIHNVSAMEDYAKKKNLKYRSALLNEPEYLSINSLPDKYMSSIKDKSNLRFFKDHKYNIDCHKRFIEYTKTIDDIHNVNIKQYIPELEQVIDEIL